MLSWKKYIKLCAAKTLDNFEIHANKAEKKLEDLLSDIEI